MVAARTTHHSGENLSSESAFVGLQQDGAGVGSLSLCLLFFFRSVSLAGVLKKTGMDGWNRRTRFRPQGQDACDR